MTTDPEPESNWRATVHELAAISRPSASEGERRAAELIASRLRALGCRASVERELAHGGYWWPIGLVNAVAAAAGLLAWRRPGVRNRLLAMLIAGTGAA